MEFSAGVLGLAGGNYSTDPDGVTPPGYEGLGFAGDAAGLGVGIAVYGEARFGPHFGLAITLGYDYSELVRVVTLDIAGEMHESLSIGSMRMGSMAKGVLPASFGRFWLGLGPEFVFVASSDADIHSPSDARVPAALLAEETNSTLLVFGGGVTARATDVIEVPFELRAARNLAQDSAWSDRVTAGEADYRVKTRSSWEFRMVIGVGARF